MKKLAFYLTITLSLLAGVISPAFTAEAIAVADIRPVVEGNNQFAVEMYSKLTEVEKGNIFFSPYSISSALAMCYAGAKGNTGAEMAKTLHFEIFADIKALHLAFFQLNNQFNNLPKKDGNELTVANALWAQKEFKFLDIYLKITRTEYQATLEELDFKTNAESCRKTINGWVEKKTNEKIKNLIPAGTLNEGTLLVLTNAIYFKGKWMDEFNKKNTKDESFNFADGSKNDVPMMNRTGKYGHYSDEGFQILEMPYAGKNLTMVVLLPDKADGITGFEKNLTSEKLTGWLSKLRTGEVIVSVPKFKTELSFGLNEMLKALGMKEAFTPTADFSGMTGKKDLFISAVIHKAYVDVNEEGTEAAAATGVIMVGTGMREPVKPIVFKADHPFLFLIRDKSTGSILFMGRIMDPRSNNPPKKIEA
jgi:serpin B